MWLKTLLLGTTLVLIPGCGGGGSNGQPAAILISPTTASLTPLGSQQFTASFQNVSSGKANWSVTEGASGGTVTQSGLYTAPALAGTYHVKATDSQNSTNVGTATVVVHIAVTVTPSPASTTLGQTQQFTAIVTGTPNTAVSWTVQEGATGGTISGTGLYSPPAAPGTFHIVATSAADSTQQATVTVVVQSGSAAGTIQ